MFLVFLRTAAVARFWMGQREASITERSDVKQSEIVSWWWWWWWVVVVVVVVAMMVVAVMVVVWLLLLVVVVVLSLMVRFVPLLSCSCLQLFGAAEEILPFTDIIPTATLAW